MRKIKDAINPQTGKTEMAVFIDNCFGNGHVGVKFPDQRIYYDYEVLVPGEEPVPPPAKRPGRKPGTQYRKATDVPNRKTARNAVKRKR